MVKTTKTDKTLDWVYKKLIYYKWGGCAYTFYQSIQDIIDIIGYFRVYYQIYVYYLNLSKTISFLCLVMGPICVVFNYSYFNCLIILTIYYYYYCYYYYYIFNLKLFYICEELNSQPV